MGKIYQPIVIEETDNLLNGLIDADFFKDYGLTDLSYARQYILDCLTMKFINGELGNEDEDFFTDEEFDKILKEIITGTILYELKDKGLIDSYEDENTEETFFLTDEGRKNIKEKGNIE
jgi:hypothetical protein